jgi:hypothetical protein
MARSVSPSQDRDPYADRRTYPRVEVALPAFLQVDFERHSVQLLDLSNGGAKLTCAARFPSGTAVMLDCGTFSRSGVVRWQSDKFLGLSFDSELDARDVSDLIARSRALSDRMTAQE